MTKKVLVYDDFYGGERGTFGDTQKIPNSFRALNMLATRDGRIGVRPGLKLTNPSGLSAGKVWAFGSTSITNADRFFVQGTSVYTFAADGTNKQVAATTLSSTPTQPMAYVEIGGSIYFSNFGDGTYRLTPASVGVPTVTRLTAVSGLAIAIHGDRLVLGNISGSSVYRCRFSDALDYTSWPAANFFDVGYSAIGALMSQRNSLVVGAVDALYMISGTPGISAVSRKIATINGPVTQFDAIVGYLDQIYYHGLGMTAPILFNGAVPIVKHNLDNGSWSNSGAANNLPPVGWGKLRAKDEGVIVIGLTNQAMVFMNGTWTFHTFGVTAVGYMSTQGVDNIVCMCDGGSAGAAPNFYNLDITKQLPGATGDTFAAPGDNSTTSLTGTLTFPQESFNGKEVQVQEVIIDFTVLNTGSSTTNHIDCAVTAFNRRSALGNTSALQTFDEAASAATGDLSRRFIAYVGDQGNGNAFQVLLTNLRGVTIDQITVIYDEISFQGAK